MKTAGTQFLRAIVWGFFLAFGLFFILARVAQGIPNPYHANEYDFIKAKREIGLKIDRPKIIFIGGSSVDYGISARLVQETTGVPAVNLGLWHDFGAEYMLEQVKHVAHRGDLVVMILEYGLYDWKDDCPYWINASTLPVLYGWDPEFMTSRPLDEQFHFAIRLPGQYFADCVAIKWRKEALPLPSESKFYAAHNPWGDNISATHPLRDLAVGYSPFDPTPELSHPLAEKLRVRPFVDSFVRWARESGVHVIATFPNTAYNVANVGPAADETERVIRHLYASLQVPVIGTVREAMFPPDHFWNTSYHLVVAAANERTALLIPRLTPFLPAK